MAIPLFFDQASESTRYYSASSVESMVKLAHLPTGLGWIEF